MEYIIRAMKEQEYPLLNAFLYEAIFVPEGSQPPPRDIIFRPELQVYTAGFGTRKDDICFVAEADGRAAGAVWVRDMNDYGHIEDGVPSFAIALYKPYRGLGLGTALMKRMLAELQARGYAKASLSVQKANAAVHLYLRLGFEILTENEEEYIMIHHLKH